MPRHDTGRTAAPLTPFMLVVLIPLPAPTTLAQGVDEVVVTAQKREQRSEDVGLSLTVLGGDDLDERRIRGLTDVQQAVPSLDIFRGNGSHNPTITLRGIGTTNPWINNNPSIAAHADGFYLPMSTYLNFPIFDLERIEVLRGPQVGLYGRNSTGGAINFVSRRPDGETSGYADASYGSYGAVDAEAAVGGALGESVNGRLAALYRAGGGYMDRPGTIDSTAGFSPNPGTVPAIPEVPAEDDYGDRDQLALRGSLSFAPTETFDAFLTVHYGTDDSEEAGSTNLNGDAIGVFTPPNTEPYTDYDNFAPFTDSEQAGGVLELNWMRGEYRLTSLTGFETLDRVYGIGDFVATRVAEANFDEQIDSIGQEFRLDYQRDDGFRWLSGLTYSNDDIDYSRTLVAYDFLQGALGTAFEQEDRAWSLYTRVEQPLGPEWLLSGSLRYTDEEKTYDGGSFEVDPFGTSIVGLAFPNVRPDGLFDARRYADEDVSGKVAVDWEPDAETLWYASIGRSFKSGGFDGSGITEPASFAPFGAETVWAYEVGGKLRRVDNRLLVTGSGFFYDYEDKQVLALMDLGGGITEAVIQNAAASEVYGLDLAFNWLATDALNLSLNATWLSSEVTDWESADPAEAEARIGNELPGTPGTMLTASVDWERPVGGDWMLETRVWATYSAEAYRDIENTGDLQSDDYTVANARIELSSNANWSAYVYAKNLFDEEYVTSVRSLVGMLGEYHGAPRTFGVGVRYEMTP